MEERTCTHGMINGIKSRALLLLYAAAAANTKLCWLLILFYKWSNVRLEIIHHTCYITEWKYETVIRHYEKQKKQINAQLTVCVCVECVWSVWKEERKKKNFLDICVRASSKWRHTLAFALLDCVIYACMWLANKQNKNNRTESAWWRSTFSILTQHACDVYAFMAKICEHEACKMMKWMIWLMIQIQLNEC